jgi:type VII secretion-associated serine protease mycosin
MSRTKAALAVLALVAAASVLGAAPAAAAPPEGACGSRLEPAHPVVTERPWAQRYFDLDRTWTHSRGAGVLVGVVDSGVDADHPQLRDRVLPGSDFFLVGDLPGNFDCVSHGTAVASIVAAAPAEGVGFRGIAPDARVLPVRVTDRDVNDTGEPAPIDPGAVAAGIHYAADQGVRVLNLSLSGYTDHRAIRDAVAHAVARDVLVVAAVGNRQPDSADAPAVPSYPAAYDGVLGVGAIDIAGMRTEGSQIGPYVDLVAPGAGVLAATRAGGHDYWEGTSFAAPFVAGAAALVRSAWPELTAPQVAARLVATAAPAPGGAGSQAYGAGIVDPYRAVTEDLTAAKPAPMPGVVAPPVDQDEVRAAAWWQRTGTWAKLAAGAVVLAIAVACVLAVALPKGRRRRWSAGRAAPLPAARVREEPPEEIFLLPRPPVERTMRH